MTGRRTIGRKPGEPKPRRRSLTSARRAASAFETMNAATLRAALQDPTIHRAHLKGSKDTGDAENVVINRQLITVSEKYTRSYDLTQWLDDAERLSANHGSAAKIVIHKRHGRTGPLDQLVTTTLGDLLVIALGLPREHFERLIDEAGEGQR